MISLVFEEDVEYICLVLETLRVFQQLGQSVVVDGSAGVSGDAALCCNRHLWDLQDGGGKVKLRVVKEWRETREVCRLNCMKTKGCKNTPECLAVRRSLGGSG